MSLYEVNNVMSFLDDELGASKAKKPKKKKKKLGSKIKKGLKKAVKAVATGGISVVADKLKGKKAGKKVKAGLKKVAKGALQGAAEVVAHVDAKTAGDCANTDELVALVAAKLVAKLGPPLDWANQTLAKFDLQRQATYEHKKLMTDSDFRKRVLAFIAGKAKKGNCSCKRTLKALWS